MPEPNPTSVPAGGPSDDMAGRVAGSAAGSVAGRATTEATERASRASLRMVPDRVRWAVDRLDPAPDARLLEIGCGSGAAAELLCRRLTTGRLLAVDRSPVAVRRTAERNAEHVRAGRLEIADDGALSIRRGRLPRRAASLQEEPYGET